MHALTADEKPAPTRRFVGFDLVRLMSLIAITGHHFVWVLWYAPNIDPLKGHLGWDAINAYARALSFSGHSILFLSAFLIAKSESHPIKTWRVILFVAAGWILFSIFESGQNAVFWVWDIYPLIILGLATAVCVRYFSLRAVYALGIFGFLMTWIPFWEWTAFSDLSLQWRHWLVGDCSVDLADWPILPWVGFIWAPYALGALVRDQQSRAKNWWSSLTRTEALAWLIVLVCAVPNLGAYYRIILGSSFACYSFRQQPLVFWSHFVFILFLLRVSMLDSVQMRLVQLKPVRWISNLRVSRSFGLFYLVHYTLIETVAAVWGAPMSTWPNLSFLVLVLILPLTELTVRLLEFIGSRLISLRRAAL